MEPTGAKQSSMKNIMVRMFLFCVGIIGFRFAYIVTIRGESSPENINLVAGVRQLRSSAVTVDDSSVHSAPAELRYTNLWPNEGNQMAVLFYSSVFQDLIASGFLSSDSKVLCLETPAGDDVLALKEMGVENSVGIYKRAKPPLVLSGQAIRQPFDDNTFDFIFSGAGKLDKSEKPFDFAAEVARTLKPKGFLVVHTASNDTYSFNSFIDLFNCCKFISSRFINGFDSSFPHIREIVMKRIELMKSTGDSLSKCSVPVPEYKQELVNKTEPLISTEPLKPWIILKRNIKNIKYLTTMADINFKQRYIYVDVGARSYGSSIVSWFKKQYPKQSKHFEIYAIEADKSFHEEYKYKKGVKLLPYAAWVKNETLLFEINHGPGFKFSKEKAKNRGMGRIQPAQSSSSSSSSVDRIQGFDFANWLKNTVSEKDFVVMKMDVEGTEFDLIPRLFETKAICLIDEIFLECHYNRWQRCCPGVRSGKYEKSYEQCLELFTSLKKWGVLVHQWW